MVFSISNLHLESLTLQFNFSFCLAIKLKKGLNDFFWKKMETPNTAPQLKPSRSFYEKLSSLVNNQPTTIIASVCTLFIVIILAIILPMYFPPTSTTTTTCDDEIESKITSTKWEYMI